MGINTCLPVYFPLKPIKTYENYKTVPGFFLIDHHRSRKTSALSREREREAMLRAFTRLRAPLRSLPKTLTLIPSPSPPVLPNPIHQSPPFSLLASPFSRSSRRGRKEGEASRDEDDNSLGVFVFGSDHETPPRLLILQPRLRPDSLLNSKLGEAINLANSLEEQRDGFFAKEFADKNPPPHLIVQNPASRSRTHAGLFDLCLKKC